MTIPAQPADMVNYFYQIKFNEQHDYLMSLPVGPLTDQIRQELVDLFNLRDTKVGKGYWHADANPADWSLANAEITYNGLNSFEMPTKFNMKWVVIVQLQAPLRCRVYLQHNEPVIV